MKRNIKIIIAASLVLILLIGGYFFLSKWEPDTEKGGEDSPEISYTDAENIIDVDAENIAFVKVNTGESSYTVRNGNPATIEGYSSHIMDDSKLSGVIYGVSSVTAGRILEDYTGTLSDYGLEDTKKSVLVSMKDGTQYKLLIGNSTNFDGEHYAMLEGENRIITLSSYDVENLIKEPSEMRSKNICKLESDNIMSFTIKKNGKKEVSVKYDKNYVPSNEYQSVSYLVTYPYSNVTASLDKLQALFENITSLSAQSIVEENPKNLSRYGLDKPYELEITDFDGKKTTVRTGDYGENGSVYLMYNDVPVVYLAECPFYEAVKTSVAAEYVERFIHLFNIQSLEKVVITANGEEHVMSVTEKSKDEYSYKIDEKNVSEDKFKKIYQLVIGVTAADFTSGTARGEEEYSFTFCFNDGTKKTFTYYNYNERYSIVKADNNLTCLTLTKNLENILNELKS